MTEENQERFLLMEISSATIVTCTFSVIYFLVAFFILLGNISTIFVFWKHRGELKRTSYLLLNLAFADLLVGISVLHVAANGIQHLASHQQSRFWKFIITNGFDSFSAFVALISLLAMTLERLYAIRWPFRHRTMSIRSYIYSVAFVWILAGIMCIFDFLSVFFHNEAIGLSKASSIIVALVTSFSLAITCASYVLIRQQTRQNIPGIRAQQNKKLTNTLLIVTVVSVFCWLPMIIYFTAVFGWSLIEDVASNHSYYTLLIVKTLQYSNSMVNPILYAFRLPMFKLELQKCCSKFFSSKEFDGNKNPYQDRVRVSAQRTNVDITNLHNYNTKL